MTSKKWVYQRRSSSSRMLQAVKAGKERTVMIAVVPVLYMNSGILLMLIPGARNRRMVTMKLMAPPLVEIVNRISARL